MFKNYREILSLPGALKFSLAGLVARMPIAVLGLGIVLFIQGVSGSYGLAGIVAAVFMIVQAIAGPGIARFVDRYGQARVMVPIVIIHLAGLLLLILSVYLDWWTGFVFVFAGIAGATVGSVGSLVRSRWSHVVGSPKQLQTAFSWESVADELLFVSGPVLATVMATAVWPPAGIILSMLSTAVGSTLLYIQKSTEPPPVERTTEARGHVFSNPGIFTIILVNVFLGVNFGAIDVIAVAFSDELGLKPLAGILLSAFALGSLISGALYGSRNWTSATHHRFGFSVSLLAIGACSMLLAQSMLSYGIILFLVGFTIAPSLIGANSVIEQLAPPRRLTEAFAWLGTSLGFGVAFGSAIAGNIIDAANAKTAMLLPAGCALIGAVLALSLLKLLNPTRSSHEVRLAKDPRRVRVDGEE
ncbi:MFS transporter [Brevibacterium sp. CCUG 69071]|uniref:MFS transporter n=1 Tax=Brevibacterium sp. CCUG 69071 TaxID=2052937 RepID=UPI001E604671|nr:MFS transporter [Brevibacterium sp. CCUG 69071]MCD1287658.1 MFS transporter [Brevibacterium sp. CCUG 69071]